MMLTSGLSFLGLARQPDKMVLPVMDANCRLFLTIAVNPSTTLGDVQQPVTCVLSVHTVKRTRAVVVFGYVGTQSCVTRFLG